MLSDFSTYNFCASNDTEKQHFNCSRSYAYGFRQFDSQIARWHSIDKLAEWDYSTSAYAYVAGNPISYYDVEGLHSSELDNPGFQPDVWAMIVAGWEATPEDGSSTYSGDELQAMVANNGGSGGEISVSWTGYTGRSLQRMAGQNNLFYGFLSFLNPFNYIDISWTPFEASDNSPNNFTTVSFMADEGDPPYSDNDPTDPSYPSDAAKEASGNVLKATGAIVGALAADDVTGIGVADDVLIPVVVFAGGVGALGTLVLYDEFAKNKKEKYTQKGKTFKGGKQKNRDRDIFQYEKGFRRWFHEIKDKGAPNASKEELAELYLEWIELGRPVP